MRRRDKPKTYSLSRLSTNGPLDFEAEADRVFCGHDEILDGQEPSRLDIELHHQHTRAALGDYLDRRQAGRKRL